MTITNDAMSREIVAHLISRSPEQRWRGARMADYLDAPRWKVVSYEEHKDVDTGEEFNTRVFGLSGASQDGRQSGQVAVTTNDRDTAFHRIAPVMLNGKLTAAQHDFIALARGEAQWIMDAVPPESTHPDFGSW